MTKKICISGYYGFDNFGDETILKILVENLKQFECKPEITVFSTNPDKTSLTYKVKSVHSFNPLKVFFSILKSDCLISGGGSLLQDVTSNKSLIYYILVLILAVVCKKKIIIFAQGIGPINNKFLSKMTAWILKKANYITVRDKNSIEYLNHNGIKSIKCFDPVWSLDIKQDMKNSSLGIQLREFNSINDEFFNKFANSINNLYSNKKIKLISLQNQLDYEICNKFKNKLLALNPNINCEVILNTSNEEIIQTISQLDELIAMRFHACLIAIKCSIKLLPINYDIKVEQLCNEFNLNYINISKIDNIQDIIEDFKNKIITYDESKIQTMYFNFKELEKNL